MGAAGPTGPSGTTNQSVTIVYQTLALTLTANEAATLVPGLSDVVTMPAAGTFHVNVCGAIGVSTTSMANNGFSDVTVAFVVDSARGAGFPGNVGGEAAVAPVNNTGLNEAGQEWSQCYTFPNGTFANSSTHTFQIGVQGDGIGSTSIIGASAGSDLASQGQLYVEIIEE
jgi:hypothetical protein